MDWDYYEKPKGSPVESKVWKTRTYSTVSWKPEKTHWRMWDYKVFCVKTSDDYDKTTGDKVVAANE